VRFLTLNSRVFGVARSVMLATFALGYVVKLRMRRAGKTVVGLFLGVEGG
jgi:hypothetical protein